MVICVKEVLLLGRAYDYGYVHMETNFCLKVDVDLQIDSHLRDTLAAFSNDLASSLGRMICDIFVGRSFI